MFAVIVLIYGLLKNRLLLLTAILIAFLAYFAVPRIQTRLSGVTDPADSAAFRIISWNNALTIFKDNSLIGIGFNTYRYVQKDYEFIDDSPSSINSGAGADSSLLLVLATTGIIGTILFLTSFAFALKENKETVTLAVMGSLLVHSLFVNSVFYPQIMFVWVVVIIGCATAISSSSRT
jgi:O-antigen ligase